MEKCYADDEETIEIVERKVVFPDCPDWYPGVWFFYRDLVNKCIARIFLPGEHALIGLTGGPGPDVFEGGDVEKFAKGDLQSEWARVDLKMKTVTFSGCPTVRFDYVDE